MTTSIDVLSPDREPWEKQPGESRQAFAAFAAYRDLSFTRSLMKAAHVLLETQPGRKGKPESVKTQLSEWSTKWRWQDRVDAWDLAMDRRHREALESDAVEAARRQGTLGRALQTAVARRLRGDPENGVQAIDVNAMEWSDISSVTRVGVNTERLAMGLPTDLLQRAQSITPQQHLEVVTRLIDECALPLIPVELQERFWQAVDRVASGRG